MCLLGHSYSPRFFRVSLFLSYSASAHHEHMAHIFLPKRVKKSEHIFLRIPWKKDRQKTVEFSPLFSISFSLFLSPDRIGMRDETKHTQKAHLGEFSRPRNERDVGNTFNGGLRRKFCLKRLIFASLGCCPVSVGLALE